MSACSSQGVTQGEKPVNDTAVNEVPDTTLVNPTIDATDTLTDLRYEYHRVDGGRATEVLSISGGKTPEDAYLYSRVLGSIEGWSYTKVDARAALDSLAQVVLKHDLASHRYVALKNEDTTRSRWMVEAKYASGKVVSVVEYFEPNDAAEAALRTQVEGIFANLLRRLLSEPLNGDYSCSTYDANDRLTQRIDYLPDGTVRGGYDPDDPTSTF